MPVRAACACACCLCLCVLPVCPPLARACVCVCTLWCLLVCDAPAIAYARVRPLASGEEGLHSPLYVHTFDMTSIRSSPIQCD